MDPATLIGFAVSVVALFVFMILEGVSPTALIFLPAIVLVIIATFGAAAASQTMDDLKKVGSWFKMAVMPAKVPPPFAMPSNSDVDHSCTLGSVSSAVGSTSIGPVTVRIAAG